MAAEEELTAAREELKYMKSTLPKYLTHFKKTIGSKKETAQSLECGECPLSDLGILDASSKPLLTYDAIPGISQVSENLRAR